ncbi:hypothetical protein CW734_12970 [Planococcus sp. MB-3u-03]|uniref:hypothetical protein n=1 Tax=Planococcus sp. MB-3u-03 TaxID=2058136 RepID=UPI000C32DFA9|nr:hypothetical protein [Planococcus sp. MB-3u-03]AUD14382.1 hypothetical protein CW734_12970 [Planococcus sp. MB-3u-03]
MRKEGQLRALDLQEFVEQALWMLKTSKREERTWLMEVTPLSTAPSRHRNWARGIAVDCPGAGSRNKPKGAVYVLVKETEGDSIQPLLKRIEQKMNAKSEAATCEVKKTAITTVGEMGSLLS